MGGAPPLTDLGRTCNPSLQCPMGADCLALDPSDAVGFCSPACTPGGGCAFAGPGAGECAVSVLPPATEPDHCGILCGAGGTCPGGFDCQSAFGRQFCVPTQ